MREPKWKARQAEWDALLKEAYESRDFLPDTAKQELAAVINRICDIGDHYRIHPRVMAAAVASIIGSLSLVECQGDVHADEHFDQFVDFGHAAVHVAVATARLSGGWTPGGPN